MYKEQYEAASKRIQQLEGMNLELSSAIRLAGAVLKDFSNVHLQDNEREYLEKVCKKLKTALREYVCEAF